ncbi:S66 peptidase family protein [Pinibacter aurantiacus]|uniref:LD-carboxypeptidase n=1 Tax=Pinibacter aurantiacus TaxID=2851599 RepID=A0A9E2SBN9_9BACT|nr:LD-carboxypeptidase [Pinibacter aurantiacus]MBV4356965.1 LD-carboxypeptidase [Pinibacter aurantiacus]
MITIPPYLKPGDTIGIVCPAGYMPYDKAEVCINTLLQWGYKVKVGKTLGGGSTNYFSGTDEERLNDFQQMLDDKEVKAILCGRGGYGVSRIIDDVDFKHFEKHPKWIIGFSDITVFHSHIYANYKIASIHSPMAAAFNDEGYKNEYVLSLKETLEGKAMQYACPAHEFNKTGTASGELVGGNLALLAHLIGSKSEVKTKNRILFIEDIGEYTYNIDRMMLQLKRAGKLDELAGLIIGGFTDMKDTTRPFGKTVFEIIQDIVKDYKYPICFDFPVSHDTKNYALKVGAEYELKVGDNEVKLREIES